MGNYFAGAARYEVTQDFYDKDHYYNPVIYEYQLANISKTSYTQTLTSYAERTRKLLTRDVIVNVMVDLEKRIPTPVPDTFVKHFTDVAVLASDVKVPPILPVSKPADALKHDVQVDTTCMDYYYHTNQANYIKFAHDAASVLTFNGQLKLGHKDFAQERIKMMEMIYKSESNAGDRLTVHCWQSNERELSFQIENAADSRVVFQTRFEMY